MGENGVVAKDGLWLKWQARNGYNIGK
uniref:Uncharacterized protein n=1 Tax=Arundo donax TaxID=35708 RepID=A0A0A9A067_ARUDO